MNKHRPMALLPRKIKGRPRVLFYSHDGLGLGHFRITLAVAEGLANRVPTAARLLLTALPSLASFDLPATLEFIRMPGLDKRRLFKSNRKRASGDLPDVFGLRSAIIAAAIDQFSPHMVVVDQNPVGLGRELLPTLKRYRKTSSRPLFVFGMRDITYEPEVTRREWARNGSCTFLEQLYDLVLIYGSPNVFDPIREYGLSSTIAAKSEFTGYIRGPKPISPEQEIREQLGALESSLVVVSAGGGSDGATLIGTFLEAMKNGYLDGVVASVVAGPQMPQADLERLAHVAAELPSVTFVRFRNDLDRHVAAADAVVTMGGYNSVWEAVGAGKHPIIVPREGRSGEQTLRADRLAALGLATAVPSVDLTSVRLADAVMTELRRGDSPAAATVDFGGIERAGEAMARLLGH